MKKLRFVVFEQNTDEVKKVGDIFGVFYDYKRAQTLAEVLQNRYPNKWFGIRELYNGNNMIGWIKS